MQVNWLFWTELETVAETSPSGNSHARSSLRIIDIDEVSLSH